MSSVERNLGFREEVEVSAIVSTYDSDFYIERCLEDLVSQTLYKQGKAEIIVIDCNSPGGEGEIVRKFQETYPRITYVRITERETLAGAWNIGIKYAEGCFVTNANTDDRHHPECFEKLAEALRSNPEVDLVYADVFQSTTPNESFDENKQTILYRYKPYFAPEVLFNYQFGCQPMWRATVHEKCGYFDRTLQAASDYEFNLRFALAGCRAMHVQEPLGLFLERTDSLSQGDETSADEQAELRQSYITPEAMLQLYSNEGWPVITAADQIRAFHDLSIRAVQFEFPWLPGQPYQDPQVALVAVTAALALDGENSTLLNNFAVLLHVAGRVEQAAGVLSKLKGKEVLGPVAENLEKVARKEWPGEKLIICATL